MENNFKEIIRKRIDRFNNLWNTAVGYSFEDSDDILKKKFNEENEGWLVKANEAAKNHGFGSFEDYLDCKYDDDPCESIDELDALENIKPRYSGGLYHYEMTVINQAESIANFILKKFNELSEDLPDELGVDLDYVWDRYAKGSNGDYVDAFTFVKKMKNDGYNEWDEGHSGNSGGMAVMFASCLLFKPEIFPYLHGALSPLVGDKGYYDDRKDIPQF